MAKVFELTCWPVTVVPESELSHTTTVHHGFCAKTQPSWWKNHKNHVL